ncbi:MAG: DKNYY domain-containing protein [Flavobacteriaceae bacterium]|nr:DKNYY domain-containing protein [Flavobacteriaceae bacterium]
MKENIQANTNRQIKYALIAAFVLFFLAFVLLFLFIFNEKIDSYEIEKNGKRFGKSEFIEYQGEIFVPVPSGGRYVLEDVDLNSFKAVEDESTLVVGLDKNRVYFGNIPIPDLDPSKLQVIGKGYYTDGKSTYFCSPYSQRNEDLSTSEEMFQNLAYIFSKTKKPQRYIYPYKKIETNKRLQPVENLPYFATDGEKVYYRGEVLEKADLNTLKSVDRYNGYFADKEKVYYKSKLLPIKNSGKLRVVSSKQGDEFLYDEANGYVFQEDYSFDREKAPYRVLGNEGGHLNHLVFINKEGIYYYDNEEKKQERAGDNFFIGKIEEITPNIFTDDENLYYFHAYDVWRRSRYDNGLDSRNTEIYSLGKKTDWKKIEDTSNGGIWQKGNKYYYFDDLGIRQLISNTIYEITDKETLALLRGDYNNQRLLIANEKLIPVEGDIKLKIVVKRGGAESFFRTYIIIFIALVIVGALHIHLKNKR